MSQIAALKGIVLSHLSEDTPRKVKLGILNTFDALDSALEEAGGFDGQGAEDIDECIKDLSSALIEDDNDQEQANIQPDISPKKKASDEEEVNLLEGLNEEQ